MTQLKLERVHYMPGQLEPGILYVSEEFQVAGHLCPCGCGNKVITPLGIPGWTFEERNEVASLDPSIDSYQLPCESHYFITRGEIQWCAKTTPAQRAMARQGEEQRRQEYERSLEEGRRWRRLKTLWNWIRSLFG